MDWVVQLLGALAALTSAIAVLCGVLLVQARKAKSEADRTAADIAAMRRDAAITREQVTNDHRSNLRDDLSLVLRGQAELRVEMAELRAGQEALVAETRIQQQGLDLERTHRMEVVEDAAQEHQRLWKAIRRRRAWWR